jgi:hypothetical protein
MTVNGVLLPNSMRSVFRLYHQRWCPVQLSKDNRRRSSQSDTDTCRCDAQQGHQNLRIVLELLYVLCPLNLTHTAINSHELVLIVLQLTLDFIQDFHVVSKHKDLDVVL